MLYSPTNHKEIITNDLLAQNDTTKLILVICNVLLNPKSSYLFYLGCVGSN